MDEGRRVLRTSDLVRLVASWALAFAALLLTALLLPGFTYTSWLPLLAAAGVTGVVGALVRPLLVEVAAAIGWIAVALATGCRVLISTQVNIWQEIEAGGVGGVVPTRVEPLTAALRTWMVEDEPRRLAAAAKAKAFATARYDWRALATRWATHYEKLKRR